MPLPAVRQLDFQPIEHEGESYIVVSDPTGILEDPLIVTPFAYYIAAHLNGHNDIADIVAAFSEQFDGANLPEERVLEVVELLDEHGLLLTDTFDTLRKSILGGFLESDVRPAHFAGKSYPASSPELRAFLDEQFTRPGGPGELPAPSPPVGDPLPGLIVPHIDFQRGGHSYAHGYHAMAKQAKPDTVIVFGVAHMAQPAPFILTRKAFQTPLGTLDVDLECVEALEAACTWGDPYEYELVHRTEHSVEFQAVMLTYLYGAGVRIVPVLTSIFDITGKTTNPDTLPAVAQFMAAVQTYVRESGKKVTVIASADLAHVGKRFGDPYDIDDTIVAKVAERDRADLAHVVNMEAVNFYTSVMQDENARKVCGLNCIYATLKALEGVAEAAEPIHYDYAHDPAGGIVSFASLALR